MFLLCVIVFCPHPGFGSLFILFLLLPSAHLFSLLQGCKKMDKIYHDLVTDVKITDRSLIWNTDLIEGLELQNLMINAKQVISAKPPC